MQNFLKRKPKPYVAERTRLLEHISTLTPESDEYEKVMKRIDQLDKILNRTTELKKTVIPALGTVSAVGGLYALQQFGGVIVPKVVDMIASRNQQKHPKENE
jgi:tetrahydromethanopterin S-methyltransferase subunit G